MRCSGRLLLYYPNRTFVGADRRVVQYQWLPRRLLLVRHGESEANVDRHVYSDTPDWRIPLTERGKDQAFDCGRRLRRIVGDEKLYIYYSPYIRTRQTLEEIRKSLDDAQIQGEREDERLREQEMGNYQPISEMDATWAARNRFSRLYYRFPFGESSADVGDRVSGFFDSLLRERIGLTVPNMNEGMITDASEEVAWLGLGRWHGKQEREPESAAPMRTGAPSSSRFSSASPEPKVVSSGPQSHTSSSSQCSSSSARCGPAKHHATITVPASEGFGAAGWEHEDGRHAGGRGGGAGEEQQQQQHNGRRPVSELGAAMDRGVLPPNNLGAAAGDDQNVVIIAHGLLIRLFIGRWFRVPMEVFETMCNPPNCSITVLEKHEGSNRLFMTDVSKRLFGSDPLLQMMPFDGREDTQWYRERFLGIIDPERDAQRSMQTEDDDENHYSRSKTPREYVPPENLRDHPPVQRPRSPSPPPPEALGGSPSIAASGAAQPQSSPRRGPAVDTTGVGEGTRAPPCPDPSAAPPSEDDPDEDGRRGECGDPLPGSSEVVPPPKPPQEWSLDRAGGDEPNVGLGEETGETRTNLKRLLSRGFW